MVGLRLSILNYKELRSGHSHPYKEQKLGRRKISDFFWIHKIPEVSGANCRPEMWGER